MKTRIAPTPNGFLHLGNIYSFYITWILARKHNAKIILRIDDFDQHRVRDHFIEHIIRTVDWMNIPIDDGPSDLYDFKKNYSQNLKTKDYLLLIEELCKTGKVYPCSCSRKDIIENSPDGTYPGTCRFKKIEQREQSDCLRIRYKEEDFIILRKDSFTSYQLVSVAEDLASGCDLIIRGEDLRPSTFMQRHLAHLLGRGTFNKSIFYHHPLITNVNGQKLSKSNQDNDIQGFLKGSPLKMMSRLLKLVLDLDTSVKSFEHFEELMSPLIHKISQDNFT